jgi:hypothetical protein
LFLFSKVKVHTDEHFEHVFGLIGLAGAEIWPVKVSSKNIAVQHVSEVPHAVQHASEVPYALNFISGVFHDAKSYSLIFRNSLLYTNTYIYNNSDQGYQGQKHAPHASEVSVSHALAVPHASVVPHTSKAKAKAATNGANFLFFCNSFKFVLPLLCFSKQAKQAMIDISRSTRP